MVSLAAGFLVYSGHFQFIPAFSILLLGDFVPDVICYYIGRFGNRRKIMEKYGSQLNLMEKLWREHGKKTMFLSKLAYSLSIPFLISAGLVNMPLRRFISYAFPITIFQYAAMMAIGYYLGSSYGLAVKYVSFAEIIIAAILVVFIAGYVFFIKYARREIEKMEKEEL